MIFTYGLAMVRTVSLRPLTAFKPVSDLMPVLVGFVVNKVARIYDMIYLLTAIR